MRRILIEILIGLGQQHVEECTNAADALERVGLGQIDIAFVDLLLESSASSGLAFIKSVRRHAHRPLRYLPIVVVTAYSERKFLRSAVDAGADEFLVKPVSPARIATRIGAVVHARRPFIKAPGFFGPDRRRRVDPKYKGRRRRFSDAGDLEL